MQASGAIPLRAWHNTLICLGLPLNISVIELSEPARTPPLRLSATIRGCLGRLVLLLFGLLTALLVIEFGTRLLGVAPPTDPLPVLWGPHPYLGWFHVPNHGGLWYSEYREFETQVHINARGLRDREIPYDKPAGVYRILVLGDSFAEALQVPLEATFAKQLEAMLSTPARPVEVINAGVGGWGTDQEAVFYAIEGFRYQPDLVLLCFFAHNDVLNNYQPLEVARVHGAVQKPFFQLKNGELVEPHFPFEAPPTPETPAPPLLSVYNWLHDHVAFYRLVVPYLRDIPPILRLAGPSGLLGGMAVFMADDPSTPLTYDVYRPDPPAAWQEAWQLTAALLRRLQREVHARGSRLALVIIGAPEQVYPERWQAVLSANPDMQGQDWDLNAPNRQLASILDESGIPYLDLLPVFQAEARSNAPALHFRHDGHWTPDGHRLAARAIAAFLQQRLWAASR